MTKKFFIGKILLSLLILTSCNDLSPEQVENKIAKSDKLTNLNKFCMQLPVPYNFNLAEKQLSGNSNETAIVYNYQSNLKFEEVKQFYSNFFQKEGWESGDGFSPNSTKDLKTITFRSENRKVGISKVAFKSPLSNYTIYCSEKN